MVAAISLGEFYNFEACFVGPIGGSDPLQPYINVGEDQGKTWRSGRFS